MGAARAGAVLVPANPGLSVLFGKTYHFHNSGRYDRPRPPPRPSLSFRRLSRPHHHHCQNSIGFLAATKGLPLRIPCRRNGVAEDVSPATL